MRLGQKGLIVLTIPLVFEVGIASSLWFRFKEAQQKADNITISRDIILKSGVLSSRLIEASTNLMLYNVSGSVENLDIARKESRQLDGTTGRLAALLGKTGRGLDRIDKLNASIGKFKSLFNRYSRMESDATLVRFFNFNKLRQELESFYPEFRGLISLIAQEEKAHEGRDVKKSEQLTRQIEVLLICFLTLSVLLTVFIGYAFHKDIVSRLVLLEKNFQRLGERKPLLETISGSDELTHLDSCLRDAADALARAERDKQQVVAMLSHDLRSPLQSVLATLTLVEEGLYGSVTETGSTMIKRSKRSVERVTDMVNEFLELEKLAQSSEPFTPVEIMLDRIIQDAVDIMTPLAERKGVSITAEIPDDLKTVADDTLLVRLFTNLLSNAVKFSDSGSTVVVDTAIEEDFIVIKVIDTGAGIEAESLAKIFEPFYQSKLGKAKRESTGLGLAVCRQITTAHGGEICVESAVDKGSTFIVKFPRSNA